MRLSLFGFDRCRGFQDERRVEKRINSDAVDTVNEKTRRALRERRSFQNRVTDSKTARWDGQTRRCRICLCLGKPEDREDYSPRRSTESTQARRGHVATGRSLASKSEEVKQDGTGVLDGTTKRNFCIGRTSVKNRRGLIHPGAPPGVSFGGSLGCGFQAETDMW